MYLFVVVRSFVLRGVLPGSGFHYAPFASDFRGIKDVRSDFDLGTTPFCPRAAHGHVPCSQWQVPPTHLEDTHECRCEWVWFGNVMKICMGLCFVLFCSY